MTTVVVVRKGGTVALPARHVFEVVKVLPDGDVTVTVEKNFSARIKSGKRRFDLSGGPVPAQLYESVVVHPRRDERRKKQEERRHRQKRFHQGPIHSGIPPSVFLLRS